MPLTDAQQGPGRARRVYDELMTGLSVGELIRYEDVGVLLDLDPDVDRQIICAACRQAGKWLLQEQQRAIDVVPGVGYRVVEAREHIGIYERHRRKSFRAVRRGQAALEHVNREELDEFERRIVDNGIASTALTLDMYRRLKRDQERMKKGLALATGRTDRTDRTDVDVERLRARIERLERNLDPSETNASDVDGGSESYPSTG